MGDSLGRGATSLLDQLGEGYSCSLPRPASAGVEKRSIQIQIPSCRRSPPIPAVASIALTRHALQTTRHSRHRLRRVITQLNYSTPMVAASDSNIRNTIAVTHNDVQFQMNGGLHEIRNREPMKMLERSFLNLPILSTSSRLTYLATAYV